MFMEAAGTFSESLLTSGTPLRIVNSYLEFVPMRSGHDDTELIERAEIHRTKIFTGKYLLATLHVEMK
jgi:hypothetical protein